MNQKEIFNEKYRHFMTKLEEARKDNNHAEVKRMQSAIWGFLTLANELQIITRDQYNDFMYWINY